MVFFIVAVFNEEQNILSLLKKTNARMNEIKVPYRIIFVNDGSTDKTLQLLETSRGSFPLEIVSYRPNKGVGEAFRRGFERALQISSGNDIFITKEADNTSDLGILEKMIACINEGYDLALASCYAKQGAVTGTTCARAFLSKCANAMLKLFFPIKNVNTFSSFYRAFKRQVIKDLTDIYGSGFIEQGGFEAMVELLVKVWRLKNARIIEVPMVLDGSKRAGKSKMKITKTVRGFLAVIVRQGILHRR